MAENQRGGRASLGRGLRRPGRRWRRETVASAAALAALLNATACGSGDRTADSTATSADTSLPSTTLAATTVPTTAVATNVPATASTTAGRRPVTTTSARSTITSSTTFPSSTTSLPCFTNAAGETVCAVPGRPLRRRWRRMLLLPEAGPDDLPTGDEARAEYASVASFGELALRLLAVGAPARLVAACHEAALDEIRHAKLCDELAGRPPSSFGAVPGLVNRRLGGWRRSRRVQLRRLAVESFLDGWVNEGAAAAQLRDRAARAESPDDRGRLETMAEDEQRHADLARSIVTWCFEEDPAAVGRALARAVPRGVAA